jgi:hypothetical protein
MDEVFVEIALIGCPSLDFIRFLAIVLSFGSLVAHDLSAVIINC